MAKLEIPVVVDISGIESLIDEIKHLQTYKLSSEDEQILVDRDDVVKIFADHVRANIEPERKTGRWIPCSERLPYAEYGESDTVLTTCGYRDVEDTSVRWIRELYFNGGNWCYPTGETYDQKVYAWMPLPEPYQEGEG